MTRAYTPTLDMDTSGQGAYATAEDLEMLSDLSEVDLVVKRWHRNGQPLRIRVKALDFDQIERIDRGCMVKLKDGTVVRSDARYATLTLQEAVIMPRLNDAQARAMSKHNPTIISEIVGFVWNGLSVWDQSLVDSLVNEAIPGAIEPTNDPIGDDDSAGDPYLDGPVERAYAEQQA